MTNTAEHALYSIGSKPISEAEPCGVNIRYEAEFERLEAELAKQESLNAETVDWKVVADLSANITQNSSKDLLVGAYLCYGLLVKEGYAGLAVGLNILNDMAAEHWDGLFPPAKRMRARQTAFTWLAEKAGEYVASKAPAAGESAVVIEAADKLKQLDNALVEKMADQAPMLTDLSRHLKNYRQSAEAELAKAATAAPPAAENTAEPAGEASAPAAAPTEAPVTQAAPVAAAAPAPRPAVAAAPETAAPESDADSKKLLRQLQTSMRDIASFWLTQKLSDARAYRQSRIATWMVIENAPPATNNVTLINPPAPERLKFFEAQIEKDDHASLVLELEKTLARAPFWLDGHCLVVKSLRKLGAEYEPAVQAVILELRNFLARLPEVMDLSFADEAAFANDQTRLWVESEVLVQDGDGAGGSAGAQAAADPWATALAEAKQLVSAGDTEQALLTMNQGFASAGQLRDKMYWRCAIAELLMLTAQLETASSILEQLGEDVKPRQIAEWEPQLLVKIYTLLYQSYQKQQKSKKDDKSLKEKSDRAFEQLCWFDPVNALSLKGG